LTGSERYGAVAVRYPTSFSRLVKPGFMVQRGDESFSIAGGPGHGQPRDPGVATRAEVALHVRSRRRVKLGARDARRLQVRTEPIGEVLLTP